eukprot:768495-Hanusia_phi.AAC.2
MGRGVMAVLRMVVVLSGLVVLSGVRWPVVSRREQDSRGVERRTELKRRKACAREGVSLARNVHIDLDDYSSVAEDEPAPSSSVYKDEVQVELWKAAQKGNANGVALMLEAGGVSVGVLAVGHASCS